MIPLTWDTKMVQSWKGLEGWWSAAGAGMGSSLMIGKLGYRSSLGGLWWHCFYNENRLSATEPHACFCFITNETVVWLEEPKEKLNPCRQASWLRFNSQHYAVLPFNEILSYHRISLPSSTHSWKGTNLLNYWYISTNVFNRWIKKAQDCKNW